MKCYEFSRENSFFDIELFNQSQMNLQRRLLYFSCWITFHVVKHSAYDLISYSAPED